MPDKSSPPPTRNHLLAALPGKEYKRLIPRLETVRLPLMELLYESGESSNMSNSLMRGQKQ